MSDHYHLVECNCLIGQDHAQDPIYRRSSPKTHDRECDCVNCGLAWSGLGRQSNMRIRRQSNE